LPQRGHLGSPVPGYISNRYARPQPAEDKRFHGIKLPGGDVRHPAASNLGT